MKKFINTLENARLMDKNDPLAKYRNEFLIPSANGKPLIYFCGNSLGLQPKRAKNQIVEELNKWEEHGVEGHFKPAQPWISYHVELKKNMASLVGAEASEIAIMNTLSVNIHLLMVSFYHPTSQRFKIICEHGTFPSDLYAMISQAKFRGLDPDQVIVELKPRKGEETLRTADILEAIMQHRDELALVFMGGVNYYTGQAFDMKEITNAGHNAGAIVGFDLAHAAGNLELLLHEWNVDFAVWCTYKYLNSGPGGISAAFVHEKHSNRTDLHRFTGWWGNELPSRFKMNREFVPAAGADGWQLSTSPIMLMAPLKSSLEIFNEAGFGNLVRKRKLLTSFLEQIINEVAKKHEDQITIRIITPKNEEEKGAQLSIVIEKNGRLIFEQLYENGIIADWREPQVIRLAPAPLYNTFEEVYRFGKIFDSVVEKNIKKEFLMNVSLN
jgi:kynureninase